MGRSYAMRPGVAALRWLVLANVVISVASAAQVDESVGEVAELDSMEEIRSIMGDHAFRNTFNALLPQPPRNVRTIEQTRRREEERALTSGLKGRERAVVK